MKTLFFSLLFFAAACGGIAIIDDGAGGSGNATGTSQGTSASGSTKTTVASGSTKGSSVVGTPSICDQLDNARRAAFDEAIACDACLDHDPCGIALVHDACGCAVPAASTERAAQAEDAYAAWVDAGCGPLDCATCPSGNATSCMPDAGGGCSGTCALVLI